MSLTDQAEDVRQGNPVRLNRRSMRYARRVPRFARRRTRELSRPESDWMRAGKRAMCVSARRKEPGRHEK